MTTRSTLVPRDAVDVERFITNFRAEHGVTPIGGGEGSGAPAIAEPLPAGADPAQVAPAPAPVAAAPPVAEEPPAWVDTLLGRMDQIAPPQVDPIAAELGFVQPPAGQTPAPQQVPASPGQPQPQPTGTTFPGQPQSEQDQVAAIQAWVAKEVADGVAKGIAEQVTPQFEQQRQTQRQDELDGLRRDYPEFQDPTQAVEIVGRARQWSQMMAGSDELAKEPAFLEMVLLAGKQIDVNRTAQAAQQPGGVTPTLPQSNGYPIEQPGPAAPGGVVDPQQAIAQRIADASKGRGLSSQWI